MRYSITLKYEAFDRHAEPGEVVAHAFRASAMLGADRLLVVTDRRIVELRGDHIERAVRYEDVSSFDETSGSSVKLSLRGGGVWKIPFDSGGSILSAWLQLDARERSASAERFAAAHLKAKVEVRARQAGDNRDPTQPVEIDWACPKCGPGPSIILERLRYHGYYDNVLYALAAQWRRGPASGAAHDRHYFRTFICRSCGYAELYADDPHSIDVTTNPFAKLGVTRGSAPYR